MQAIDLHLEPFASWDSLSLDSLLGPFEFDQFPTAVKGFVIIEAFAFSFSLV